ncbi:MAG TPA: hypothetical protein VI356_04670 [Myxococcales bacterium]
MNKTDGTAWSPARTARPSAEDFLIEVVKVVFLADRSSNDSVEQKGPEHVERFRHALV